MFDIGWSELLVIGIVALVVIGPKELPTVLRKVGQGVGKLRRMAGEFQGQFNEALREAELSEFKDNITGLKNDLGNLANDARDRIANAVPTNPLHDIENSLKAPTGAVESKDLPSADIEAQLPPPSELETNAFETIEEQVRTAAEHVAPVAPAVAAAAPAVAKPGDAKPADAKPADVAQAVAAKPAVVPPVTELTEKPKRAPRRKATPTVEREVADAVADLDGSPAAKTAPKPRARAKADPTAGTTKAASTRTTATRTRIARKPGGSTGDEGPAA